MSPPSFPGRPAPAALSPRRSNRGVVLFIVAMSFAVVAVFILYFHKSASHAQWVAARFERSERLRLVAESAMDEAMQALGRDGQDPKSDFFQWLLTAAPRERAGGSRPVPVERSRELLQGMVGAAAVPKVEAAVRVFDFYPRNHLNQLFSALPNEGIGTMEVTVEASLARPTGALLGSCSFVRHTEFKLLSLVTPANLRGNAYCAGALLDFALLVRQGAAEFDYLNSMLNSDRVKFSLVPGATPAACGLVFFGGTETSGKTVFLNIDEDFAEMIPNQATNRTLATITLTADECFTLAPKLKPKPPLPGIPGIENLRGHFERSLEPVWRPNYSTNELRKLEDRILQTLSSPQIPNHPGFRLLGPDAKSAADPALARASLRGRIRQRFLTFVHFWFDFRTVGGISKQIAAEYMDPKNHVPCYDLPPSWDGDKDAVDFQKGLLALNQSAKYAGQLVNRFDTDYLYRGGETVAPTRPTDTTFDPPPDFLTPDGSRVGADGTAEAGRPFQHVNLWSRRFPGVSSLEDAGIIDRAGRRLNLNGLVQVQEVLRLDGGTWTIHGQGGIIADGFVLASGLEKAGPEDLCILITRRGTITVDTSAPVQAVLLASRMIANQPLNLKGAMILDTLNSHLWKDGKHRMEYDPLLKSGQPLMRVFLSRWVSFERITENEGSAQEKDS